MDSESKPLRQMSLGSFFGVSTAPKVELDEFGNPVPEKRPSKRVKTMVKTTQTQRRDISHLYTEEYTEETRLYRRKQLDRLREEMFESSLPLMEMLGGNNKFVFDKGNPCAGLMIIGEAPGYHESLEGKPFVGKSGELLDKHLREHNIDLERDVYVTNVVKIRPSNTNRDPSFEECEAYLPYLRQQIAIVQPKMILCLGRIASTIVYNGIKIGESLRGGPHSKADGQSELKSIAMISLYRNASNLSAVCLPELKAVYRSYFAYHPSAILQEKDDDTLAKRWTLDFENVAKNLVLPRLKHINAVDFLGGVDANFSYHSGTDIFHRRDAMSPQQKRQLLNTRDNVFEFNFFTVTYSTWHNTFDVMGKTRCNRSVHMKIAQPEFTFWAGCGDIYRADEREVKMIADLLSAELVQEVEKRENLRTHGAWIRVKAVQRRGYMHYQRHTKQYLELTYSHDSLKYFIKEHLQSFYPRLKTFEMSLKPTQQLMLSRNIYSYGWVEVPVDSSLQINTGKQDTYCDIELSANYADLHGQSPNYGESDERFQAMPPIKVLSLDAEMLNTEGFPVAEQNPVVAVCVYAQTYNNPAESMKLEERRNPKDPTKVKLTGRSNYDHAAVFTIGPVGRIESERYRDGRLPNPPELPKKFPKAAKGIVDGKYSAKYIIALRTWNSYIGDLKQWARKVGTDRAKLFFPDATLYKTLFTIEKRPDSTGKNKPWEENKVKKWEKQLQLIRRLYKKRFLGDVKDLPRIDYDAVPEHQRAVRLGSIQAEWEHFHCEKRVFCFDSEEEMMRGLYSYMQQYDPDLITGWNVADFDLDYFVRRVQVLDIRSEQTNKLISMGRYREREDSVTKKRSVSKARGERLYKEIHLPGRDVLDMLHVFLADAYGKFESYTLAFISQNFLGDTKNDVPYSAIPSLFKNNPERLNDYCLKDAELVLMLMNFLNTMNFVTAFCQAISIIEIGRLFMDGQQGKVFSCLMRFLRKEGLSKVFPDVNIHSEGNQYCEEREPKGYTGSWVGDGVMGLIILLLVCLDYASLYPSIMVAYNLSHDVAGWAAHMIKQGVDLEQCTKTNKEYLNPKTGKWEHYYFLKPRKFFREQLAAEGIDEADCYVDLKDPAINPATGKADGTYMLKCEQGALVGTVRKMLDDRYRTKQRMKAYNPWDDMYKVLDSIQLVKKLLANSTYGTTGVTIGKLVMRAIAEQVTTTGAMHIQEMDQGMREKFGASNYGGDTDSIFQHFPAIKKLSDVYEECEIDGVVKKRIDHYVDYSNTLVPHPVRNEFEKCYYPYLGYGKKKKSMYLVHEPYYDSITESMVFDGKGKFGNKGLEITRRDGCTVARETMKGWGERLLRTAISDGVEAAKHVAGQYAKQQVDKVKNNEIPFYQLIESRQLSSTTYKSESLPHVQVCKKLKKRGQSVPQLGERVPFIVVTGRKGIKRFQAAEDPDHALKHGLQPDLKYIIEGRIKAPLKRFIDTFEDAEDMMYDIFGEEKRFRINILEDDELSPYLKPLLPCVSCGTKTLEVVCGICRHSLDWQNLLAQREESRQELVDAYAERLEVCRACMAIDETEEVICSNTTCIEYFPRRTAEFALAKFDDTTQELRQHSCAMETE